MSDIDGKNASMSDDEKVNETEQEVLEQEEAATEVASEEAPVDVVVEDPPEVTPEETPEVAPESTPEETAPEETAPEGDPIDIEEPPPVEAPEDIEPQQAPADDKVSDMEIEIELLNQKLRVKTDQLVRLAADFDNFKKRAKRDCDIEQAAFAERLFTKLLPTLDAMDRAKQSVEDGDDLGHLRDGLSQIHSLFWAALKEVDVHPMDCVGKPFDPRWHEALMHHPMPGAEPNSVTVELQKGWVLGERVLRAARVGIAPDAPAPEPAPEAAPEEEPEEPVNNEGQPGDPLLDEAKEVVEEDKVELPDIEENSEPYEEIEKAQDAGDDSSTSDGEDVSEDKEESED